MKDKDNGDGPIQVFAEVHLHLHTVENRKLDDLVSLINAGFRQQGEQMSELSDKLSSVKSAFAKVGESLGAAVGRVQEDVTRLQSALENARAKIAELEALIAAGGATPEDLAALDELKAKAEEMEATLNAIDPTKEDTLPPTE